MNYNIVILQASQLLSPRWWNERFFSEDAQNDIIFFYRKCSSINATQIILSWYCLIINHSNIKNNIDNQSLKYKNSIHSNNCKYRLYIFFMLIYVIASSCTKTHVFIPFCIVNTKSHGKKLNWKYFATDIFSYST